MNLNYCTLVWSSALNPEMKAPLNTLLMEEINPDLILGADIIYEPEHAPWIQSCLLHLLRRPSSTTEMPLCHLIVTKRSTHSFEANVIDKVFSVGCDPVAPCLGVVDRDVLTYGADTKEEVEYVYYKIGWFCP